MGFDGSGGQLFKGVDLAQPERLHKVLRSHRSRLQRHRRTSQGSLFRHVSQWRSLRSLWSGRRHRVHRRGIVKLQFRQLHHLQNSSSIQCCRIREWKSKRSWRNPEKTSSLLRDCRDERSSNFHHRKYPPRNCHSGNVGKLPVLRNQHHRRNRR